MPFDFAAVTAPFRMQPGLRRMAPQARHLTPSAPDTPALHEKLAVLRDHPAQALLCERGFDAGPALRALALHAASEHPAAFAGDGSTHWHARTLGWAIDGDAVRGDGPAAIGACLRAIDPAWRPAALLALAFEQDFAVLDATTGRIAWTAVCLPSRWAPEDKVGRRFAEVHAPVADNAMLLAASEGLVRLVTGQERWERFVWTITTDGRLDEHPRRTPRTPWPADAAPAALAAGAFFRTEHQTFIPLSASPAAPAQTVFTIHVEVAPLAQALAEAPRAAAVHAALASMSDNVLAYRGLVDARDRLLAWLAERAARA